MCEICSKLTIKTPERCHWRRSGVFIVNFEHISHLFLVFLLLTLSRLMSAGKQENVVFYFFEINILQNWPIKIFTESLLQIIRSNKTYEGSILSRRLLVKSHQ